MEKMRVGKDAYMDLPDNFGGVNHIIVGAPGSGKTRYLLEPMLLQMNTCSHLIVDIKGSLYPRLHESLEDMGYETEIYDFIHMTGSHYNPLEFINSEEDALELAMAIIGRPTNREDPFWKQNAISLITGMIGYGVYFKHHKSIYLDNEDVLNRKSFTSVANRRMLLPVLKSTSNNNTLNLGFLLDMLAEAPVDSENGINPTFIERFELLNKEFGGNWWPYKRIVSSIGGGMSGRTASSIIVTLMSETYAYRSDAIKKMMKKNDFHPEELGYKKKAIFIQLKDYDASLHPVAALMINQAVNRLVEEAGASRLEVPVQIWMDDCGSYVIPSLTQYMSCCRSRGIGFSLLCQSEHQLREAYGASEAETLIQCCHAYFYLGGEDHNSSLRISIRANVMQSDVLSMNRSSMYLIQQGHKARRVAKFNEDEKNAYERNLVAMHTIHKQQSAALINS